MGFHAQNMRARRLVRRSFATAAAATAALALVPPGDEEYPVSGLTVVSLLPSGIAGACAPRRPRVPSFEVVSNGVYLCGISHVEVASAQAAIATIARCSSAAAVALECDANTLEVRKAAARALQGLEAEQIRKDALFHIGRVRQALFESETVRDMARARGRAELSSPSQVGLQPEVVRYLRSDGVLWGSEMAAAAQAAADAGCRVVCLQPGAKWMEEPAPGTSVETHSSVVRSARRRLALFAGWLRVHALCPGFDERSCDAVGVAALNQAMLEMLPREYARRVATPDEVMARRLRALRDELGRGEDATVVGYPIVVAIVGAQHVPGIVERLRSR